MNLYIIGNGFDIEHDMKTRYSNFKEYIGYSMEGQAFIESFEKLSYVYPTDLWNNFEKSLGELTSAPVLEDANMERIEFNAEFDYEPLDDFHITSHAKDQYYGSLYNLDKLVKEWAQKINVDEAKEIKKYVKLFNKDSLFITFNYTDTLEKKYNIDEKKVLHVHGTADNKPIMGHGRDLFNSDLNLSFETDMYKKEFYASMDDGLKQFHESSKKDVENLKDNISYFLDEYEKNIRIVSIIGHSMSEVDLPYYKTIIEHLPGIKWKIYYHNQEDLKNKKIAVEKLQLKNVIYLQ